MKASRATYLARVNDIHRIRADGAAWADIRQYVAETEAKGEPPWTTPEGGKPVSERQLRRYIAEADRLIAVEFRTLRKRRRLLHLARREKLFARAVQDGDIRTALAVLADLAKLEGLYPSEADELKRLAEALRKQLAERKEADGGSGNGGEAKGTDGVGERGEGAAQPDP